jgi:nitrite reductase/ring-hydroxylating ferredoxin subunit
MFWRNTKKPRRTGHTITAGQVADLPAGSGVTIELESGQELALFNVDGQFYALENFCPHRGAPLADGALCETAVECSWHGWRFDLRDGRCAEHNATLETYEVTIENGAIRIKV